MPHIGWFDPGSSGRLFFPAIGMPLHPSLLLSQPRHCAGRADLPAPLRQTASQRVRHFLRHMTFSLSPCLSLFHWGSVSLPDQRVWLFWQENDDTMSGTLNGRIGLSTFSHGPSSSNYMWMGSWLRRISGNHQQGFLVSLSAFRSSSDPLKITLSPMARRQGSYSVSRAPRHTNEAKFIAAQARMPLVRR